MSSSHATTCYAHASPASCSSTSILSTAAASRLRPWANALHHHGQSRRWYCGPGICRKLAFGVREKICWNPCLRHLGHRQTLLCGDSRSRLTVRELMPLPSLRYAIAHHAPGSDCELPHEQSQHEVMAPCLCLQYLDLSLHRPLKLVELRLSGAKAASLMQLVKHELFHLPRELPGCGARNE